MFYNFCNFPESHLYVGLLQEIIGYYQINAGKAFKYLNEVL